MPLLTVWLSLVLALLTGLFSWLATLHNLTQTVMQDSKEEALLSRACLPLWAFLTFLGMVLVFTLICAVAADCHAKLHPSAEPLKEDADDDDEEGP